MKDIKFNKIFGIYSLVLPIVVIGLLFFLYAFGTMDSDTVSRPYGEISDFLSSFTQLVICPALFIINIVLFCRSVKITKGYTILSIFLLILNTLLCLQLMITIVNIWFLIFTFIIVEPIYLLMWFIYLIYFIINYKKMKIETHNEEGIIKENTEQIN